VCAGIRGHLLEGGWSLAGRNVTNVLILVSGATATRRRILSAYLGCLIVPGSGNVPFPDRPWAADNGAFSAFDPEAFVAMLERLQSRRGCVFVAAPDVVGNAAKTLDKFPRWAKVIRAFDLPVALVAQDGLSPDQVPWIDLEALFIGGTTAWKLGSEARHLVQAAKANRKWVHMGRVNTKRRIRYAAQIGCDSIDGTTFSKWPDTYIPKGITWMDQQRQQPELAL
jgi:hypothetical protein